MARQRPAAAERRPGSTPEGRAAAKAARRAANRARHRAAQEERAAATPPTLRQRRYLWCPGYRGPAIERPLLLARRPCPRAGALAEDHHGPD